jgi:hypothetical protein
MTIVRFALRFPYTFYGLAALILFLGLLAIVVMPVDAPRGVRLRGASRNSTTRRLPLAD